MKTRMTFRDLIARFQTEDDCKAFLVERRWPNGVCCPRCGNTKVWEVKSRPFHWLCKACNKNGYRFSVITKTIFENTKYPLVEWFKVAFLMYHSKKGNYALDVLSQPRVEPAQPLREDWIETMVVVRSGGCICGAVRYEITGEPHVTYACHCTDCRCQSGSAFGLTIVLTADQLRITRGELKTHTRVADSGRKMTRYFCPECGTWIYNVPETLPDNRRVKPGTLDDASWVRPTVHLWLRSALPWVQIPADVIKHETQPSDRTWVVPPSKQ